MYESLRGLKGTWHVYHPAQKSMEQGQAPWGMATQQLLTSGTPRTVRLIVQSMDSQEGGYVVLV